MPRELTASATIKDIARLLGTYRALIPEGTKLPDVGGSAVAQLAYTTVDPYNRIIADVIMTNASIPLSDKDGKKVEFRAPRVPVSIVLRRHTTEHHVIVDRAEAGPPNLKASLAKGFTLDDKGDFDGTLVFEYSLPEALEYFPAVEFPEDFEIAGKKRAEFVLRRQAPQLRPKDKDPLMDLFAEGGLTVDKIAYGGLTVQDVQPSFTMKSGLMSIHPLTCLLNDGHANFEGTVFFDKPPFALVVSQEITAIEDVTFEKQLASRFLRFFNPIFADAGMINGKVDVILKSLYMPLTENYKRDLRAEGILKIKDLQLKDSPFLNVILGTIDKGATATSLNKISDTHFVIRDGKVHYDNMVIFTGTHELSFSGSVDIEKKEPELFVRIPMTPFLVPGKDAYEFLKDETIVVPIRGTLNAPKIALDVLTTNLDNLIKNILPKLFLQKLLERKKEAPPEEIEEPVDAPEEAPAEQGDVQTTK
jgi:hypothetical protein